MQRGAYESAASSGNIVPGIKSGARLPPTCVTRARWRPDRAMRPHPATNRGQPVIVHGFLSRRERVYGCRTFYPVPQKRMECVPGPSRRCLRATVSFLRISRHGRCPRRHITRTILLAAVQPDRFHLRPTDRPGDYFCNLCWRYFGWSDFGEVQ